MSGYNGYNDSEGYPEALRFVQSPEQGRLGRGVSPVATVSGSSRRHQPNHGELRQP